MPLADTLNRKPGDILKSDDWNIIIKEIDRLETAKINRDGADTLKGRLTIAESLKVNSNVTISGNLSVTNVLEIGDPPSAGNTGGNRDWMQKGIKINWDSDSLFIGLKDEGSDRKDAVIAWGDNPQDDLRFVNVLAGGEVQGKELMRIKPSGNVGIGTNNPIASLDIASASRTGTHPTAVKGLYITGDFNADNDGVEFRHSNATQGIGFGFNTIYAAGSNANQDLGLKPKGTGEVTVSGNLSVSGIVKAQALTVSSNLSVTNILEIGDTPFTGNTGGNRDWMQKGIKINWDTDSLFIGLKDEGSDRKDAVIAWGDNPQDDLRFINVLAGGDVQGKELMRIKPSGNVGIGTVTPDKGKLHIEGFVSYQSENYRYFVNRQDNGGVATGATGPYSLYASSRIGCPEVNVFSDLRIKEIKGTSDSQADLQTLLQIQVTDYYYKDKIAKGNRPKKKVIGQQIATVYPQAVSTHVDTVPDILEFAIIAENWVTLNNHNLKTGDKVKIFWNDNDSQLFTVEDIKTDQFKISLNHTGDIFVYGREVDDFHVVDYDALSMLHISATQELYKIIKKLEGKINEKINA
ncbi:MAG: hypothetical protein DWQ56_07515 [Microcystis aeruginosa DA14]|uniref:Peptidase S74 domain-containing protein n=1 Tax=Microcystis aeruginosa DA14 TaxID=1987506 RepID=A0A3E0MJ21_MICAE|nr:MAG: hypothetical protein DWQ56_07515 [Microcystis aeruginosa DA14]